MASFFFSSEEESAGIGVLGGLFNECPEEEEQQQKEEQKEEEEEEVLTFESSVLDKPVTLIQRTRSGIGFQLWPAAVYLSKYFEDSEGLCQLLGGRPLSELHCLELGAGVGLCGLVLAAMGASVVLTDLPAVLDNLRRNVDANPTLADRLSVAPLAWGIDEDVGRLVARGGDPDLVIVADCVYHEELFQPLLHTLCALCDNSGAVVIMAHVRRWKRDAKFFKKAATLLEVEKLRESVERYEDENAAGKTKRVVTRLYSMRSRRTIK